jgi:DNA (cytosine-5)-methyltransferase 3A
MNVLSLFDGMSCCQIALKELGIKVDSYYASEVDKYAIQTTMHNFPNTIQLGDVAKIDTSTLPEIDLLAGGSPCQSFSFAGKRKGMSTTCSTEIFTLDHYLQLKEEGFEFEGQSYLFWEYMRILKEVKPKYFLLENVEMGEKWEKILSRAIGMNGIHINSALVSAQNRKRIYWTNIGAKPSGLFGDLASAIAQPKDQGILLKHILDQDVDEKYFLSEKAIEYLNRDSLGKYSSRLAFMNYEDKSKSTCVTANHSKGIPYNMVTCVASRGRNPEKETAILQPKRTEYGKKFRKEYEEGKIKRGLVQQLEPIVDGKTNTITSVHKDNLVIQLNPSKESNGVQPYQQNRVYDTNGISPCLSVDARSPAIHENPRIRRLTPKEAKRLQTVPDWYDMSVVSETQQYRQLGNGWTIEVIKHILSFM